MSGRDGLFARQLPIASSALTAFDIIGFCRRRFDLCAINGLLCNRGWKMLVRSYAAARSGSYSVPFFIIAQAMRAVLLAKATAATL